MLDHGEKIVDTLGSEVDRIEKGLKVSNVRVEGGSCRERTEGEKMLVSESVGRGSRQKGFNVNNELDPIQ